MNSIEKKTAELLSLIGFEIKPYSQKSKFDSLNVFYAQVPFEHMKLDFGLPHAKIAIEVNGNYWHGLHAETLNTIQLEKRISDARKCAKLSENGWKLISISESQLSRDTAKLFLQNAILDRIFV